MFTQSDDDGQKFVVAYANQSTNKMKAKYNFYERGCLILGHFTIPMLFYGNPFILVTIINLKNS
jgi:hypothetical protein